jgi:hypothetical protein
MPALQLRCASGRFLRTPDGAGPQFPRCICSQQAAAPARICGVDGPDQIHAWRPGAPLTQLYPRYVRAFENKRSRYPPELRNNAEILELGTHLGAFLETAEEWGWRPTGFDVGESTCAFARRQGASVKRLPLEDYSPKLRKPEAIFIWNCFEQLENPSHTLRQSYRLLDEHELLLVHAERRFLSRTAMAAPQAPLANRAEAAGL